MNNNLDFFNTLIMVSHENTDKIIEKIKFLIDNNYNINEILSILNKNINNEELLDLDKKRILNEIETYLKNNNKI